MRQHSTGGRLRLPGPTRPALCMCRLLFAIKKWHDFGNRSYVSGLLIDTRAVALLGLRSHRDLITGQAIFDYLGRQILGA